VTPEELGRGDQLAARYLVAVLDRDAVAIKLALDEIYDTVELWDALDALAALARDLLGEIGSAELAGILLRHRLLIAALREGER
jgi:hypothetical protein